MAATFAGCIDGYFSGNWRGTVFLTRDQRYLQFAWRLFRYALIVALLVFGLLILERVAVIPL